MTIDIRRYVDITSGVGGGAAVTARELIGRLFTDNALLPPGTYLEFSSASAVGTYFGTSSEEYARAQFYFSFISKSITSIDKISFARWVPTAVAPLIFGYADPASPQALSDYTSISTGSFGLTIGGVTENFTGVDFTSAASLADVAAVLETAVQTGTGTVFTSATVEYDATAGAFNFTGGETGSAAITPLAGTSGTDVSQLIGWLPAATFSEGTKTTGSIVCAGSDVETVTEVLTASASDSDNFGSFLFMPETALTLEENIEAAEWNDVENVKYIFTVQVSSANASAWADTSTGLGEIGGCCLTLQASGVTDEYPEMLPMMILAATDYSRVNSTQNYMYQQVAGLTPSVTDDSTADSMDALRINYYGQTQQAGQKESFYQRGYMMGISTDPLFMNTYANEIWFKDAMLVELMNLLLALNKISANATGIAQLNSASQTPITNAINNGTFSLGKTLTSTQKAYITQVTGSDTAYQQVQNNGYWLNWVVAGAGDPTEYTATYTLVYSKDDVINKIEGSDILI